MPDAPEDQSENQSPKILHVFSSLELGGAQRRFIDFVSRSKAGFSHSVYAMDGNYDALKLTGDIDQPWGQSSVVPKGNTWAAMKITRRLLKEAKPDLLVTYNWGAVEWALGNRFFPVCPMVHIQDGFTEDELKGEIGKRRLVRGFAYRGCRAVVVPSKTLERVAKKSWHIHPERLKYIANGIDIERFKAPADAAILNELGIDPAKQTIGTVSGLRPEKNIGRLVEAFSLIENDMPNAQLVIVGDGVGMAALKMLASRVCKKGNVIFTGSMANPEAILPAFTLFALSSDTEQMPLTVIEAMAAGLPVVSTDVGDIATMISEENISYIEGQTAPDLAKNITALLKDQNTAKIIGEANAAKAAESFEIEKMVASYDALFTACTGK